MRWRNAEYDAAFRAFESELDPVKRAALVIRMNDLVVGDGYVIPCFARSTMRVVGTKLQAPFSAWANDMATLSDWYPRRPDLPPASHRPWVPTSSAAS